MPTAAIVDGSGTAVVKEFRPGPEKARGCDV
jgi:hypothetical protein